MEDASQPDIYNISWVKSDKFDPSKLTINSTHTDGYERGKLLYQYSPDAPKRDLVITVPRKPEAYVTCRGVQKDVYSGGKTKVETNRYGSQLVLQFDNDHHVELYKLFEKVVERVQELTDATVTFPAKDMETYSILYTNLIHSNDGKMYSSAYTTEEQIDILDCKKCIVRPALVLSTLRKSPTEVKIRVQISQMYVHKEIKDFPLAYRD